MNGRWCACCCFIQSGPVCEDEAREQRVLVNVLLCPPNLISSLLSCMSRFRRLCKRFVRKYKNIKPKFITSSLRLRFVQEIDAYNVPSVEEALSPLNGLKVNFLIGPGLAHTGTFQRLQQSEGKDEESACQSAYADSQCNYVRTTSTSNSRRKQQLQAIKVTDMRITTWQASEPQLAKGTNLTA